MRPFPGRVRRQLWRCSRMGARRSAFQAMRARWRSDAPGRRRVLRAGSTRRRPRRPRSAAPHRGRRALAGRRTRSCEAAEAPVRGPAPGGGSRCGARELAASVPASAAGSISRTRLAPDSRHSSSATRARPERPRHRRRGQRERSPCRRSCGIGGSRSAALADGRRLGRADRGRAGLGRAPPARGRLAPRAAPAGCSRCSCLRARDHRPHPLLGGGYGRCALTLPPRPVGRDRLDSDVAAPGAANRRARPEHGPHRQPRQAARLRLPVQRDLRRHGRLLGLRPARRRDEEQHQARLVARHGAGARRRRRASTPRSS